MTERNKNFQLRISPELHKALAATADVLGVSMNDYIQKVLLDRLAHDHWVISNSHEATRMSLFGKAK